MITIQDAPDCELFSQTFIGRTTKGVGYTKFTVTAISGTEDGSDIQVALFNTSKKTIRAVTMKIIKGKLIPYQSKSYFNDIISYFVFMESTHSDIKDNFQYKEELKIQKNKYPEFFL